MKGKEAVPPPEFTWTIVPILCLISLIIPLGVWTRVILSGRYSPHHLAETASIAVLALCAFLYALDRLLLGAIGYRKLMCGEIVVLIGWMTFVCWQAYQGLVDPFGLN